MLSHVSPFMQHILVFDAMNH